MTRVTFDSKALKKVRDIYSKRANEVAKNIAPTVYNIEVTTEDREITDSLATLNTVFKLTKKTITNREYVTFGNELSSKLIKLNKGSIAIISYICNNINGVVIKLLLLKVILLIIVKLIKKLFILL